MWWSGAQAEGYSGLGHHLGTGQLQDFGGFHCKQIEEIVRLENANVQGRWSKHHVPIAGCPGMSDWWCLLTSNQWNDRPGSLLSSWPRMWRDGFHSDWGHKTSPPRMVLTCFKTILKISQDFPSIVTYGDIWWHSDFPLISHWFPMFLELLSYGIYGCRSWSWAFGIKVPELFQAKTPSTTAGWLCCNSWAVNSF